MTERVLVTGGAGYVGRQVVRQLLDTGRHVLTLDRSRPSGDCPLLKVDLTDYAALTLALEDFSFDWVIHLASLPGDTGDPIEMTQVNVNGCMHLLEFSRKTKVRRFLLASSISAYEWYPATPFQPPDHTPVNEEHPCRPKDMYSTTKRLQELLALTYYHQYGVPVTVLRLTAVVGPHGRGGGHGWREFARQLANGERVQIPQFSPEEVCHYVDVRDVARMFLAAAEHPGAVGEIFNCAGPTPTRGSEFLEILQRLVPGIEVEFGFPWSMAQGGEIWFDISKAKRLIQFEPNYTLADSIASIKDWVSAGGLNEEVTDQVRTGGVARKT